VGVQSIAVNVSVCLSVCPLTQPISKATVQTSQNFLNLTCSCGLVLLWQQCSRLSTSIFLDDIGFSHNGAYFAFAFVAGCLMALYSFEGILVLFSFYAFDTYLPLSFPAFLNCLWGGKVCYPQLPCFMSMRCMTLFARVSKVGRW